MPIGFVDDDPRKQGMRMAGLKVLGTTDELPRVLDDVEPDEVIIAIPSAPGRAAPEGRDRLPRARRSRCARCRRCSSCSQGGGNVMRQVREVQVEDVLGREPVRVEIDRVGAYLRDEVVLVTGAGGSIGSELCRQIARVGPKRLVLVDHAENALFEIRRELEDDRHFHRTVAVLADCKDAVRMREVFAEQRAAGRLPRGRLQARAADGGEPGRGRAQQRGRHAHRRGRGGRAGRQALRARLDRQGGRARDRDGRLQGAGRVGGRGRAAPLRGRRAFATVRFGNVLGSSGSVVPIFRRQIAAGGPVTVTDEAMTRYFMTIPEAVQLIIRAGALGERRRRSTCSRWASR